MIRRTLTLSLLMAVAAGAAMAASEGDGHANVTLWKTVNFTILAAILIWAFRKFGVKFFNQRTADIQQGIVDAKKQRDEAEASAAEMDRRMANLEKEIDSMRTSAKEEMGAEEARLKAASEQAMARMQANAEQEIVSAGKHARKDLRVYATELALKLARQKVRDRMTPEIAGGLVDTLVTELGSASRRAD